MAALAGIYLIGVAVFSSRFLPNTTVNGENVSLMSVSDVASTASKSLDGYSGTVSGDGISFTVSASDVGLTYDGTTFANTAHSQLNA
ncbi:MAG: L,D-transpeptidase family protein, partial [Olsenella sp.]